MDEWIITQKQKGIGILILNRFKALNAINDLFQRQIITILKKWQDDPSIHAVLIKSSQKKAFCAGGDIRQIANFVREGNYKKALSVFQHNYQLACFVAHYEKPIISLMDGIAMGGGIGLGSYVPYRIVTECSILAMPEVMIGIAPDAGTSLIFQKAPGFTGLRAMLTGQRLNAEEAIQLGFADYFIYSSELETVLSELESNNIKQVLAPYKKENRIDHGFLGQIKRVYDASSVDMIIERLMGSVYEWSRKDLFSILMACPFSLRVAFQAWHRKLYNLESVIKRDECVINHLIQRADFLEGVRAAVIDKDHNPKWNQAPISESEINSCFDY